MINDIELLRDCDAILVPSGCAVHLKQGTRVMITQALGGTYTVNVSGNLARIDQKDADALGQEGVVFAEHVESGTLEDRLWQRLKTVYDPEIPVNIVDLGLIYEIKLTPAGKKNHVYLKMTLTAPGCGMGPILMDDVRRVVSSFEEVDPDEVEIDLVFDPPWDRNRISEEAKLVLGII